MHEFLFDNLDNRVNISTDWKSVDSERLKSSDYYNRQDELISKSNYISTANFKPEPTNVLRKNKIYKKAEAISNVTISDPKFNRLSESLTKVFGISDPPAGFGFCYPKYYYLEQKRPQPMDPLKVWRGFNGNIYFEPIVLNNMKRDFIEQIKGKIDLNRSINNQNIRKKLIGTYENSNKKISLRANNIIYKFASDTEIDSESNIDLKCNLEGKQNLYEDKIDRTYLRKVEKKQYSKPIDEMEKIKELNNLKCLKSKSFEINRKKIPFKGITHKNKYCFENNLQHIFKTSEKDKEKNCISEKLSERKEKLQKNKIEMFQISLSCKEMQKRIKKGKILTYFNKNSLDSTNISFSGLNKIY